MANYQTYQNTSKPATIKCVDNALWSQDWKCFDAEFVVAEGTDIWV